MLFLYLLEQFARACNRAAQFIDAILVFRPVFAGQIAKIAAAAVACLFAAGLLGLACRTLLSVLRLALGLLTFAVLRLLRFLLGLFLEHFF